MRLVRFRLPNSRARYGYVEAGRVHGLRGSPYRGIDPDGSVHPLEEVRLLAPCRPSKSVCIGLNYKDHALSVRQEVPSEPVIFIKPSTCIIGPEDPVVLPPGVERIDAEAELAVVIGRRARFVRPEKAHEYVLGYTCFNDVSARDLQRRDKQWTRAKSFDSFGPTGPWVETEVSPDDLEVICRVDGRVTQRASTRELIFDLPYLISFCSSVMTLLPGDLIATGTPGGASQLEPGGVVEVEIAGIGTLRNPLRALARG